MCWLRPCSQHVLNFCFKFIKHIKRNKRLYSSGKTTAVNVGPTPAELFVLPTVEHVVFQQREIAATVQRLFDGVLHLFDVRRLFGAVFFERGHHFAAQPAGFFAVRHTGGPHGLEDRLFDFLRTERGDLARPFYDLP